MRACLAARSAGKQGEKYFEQAIGFGRTGQTRCAGLSSHAPLAFA
jgi:hypothetical protein